MDSVPNKRTVEERIAEALSQKQRLLSDQKVLLQKYNKLQREIDNYSAMFLANEEVEEKVVSKNNPIIIGNAHTRMSILDIGKIDTTNTIIKNGHILPKGYRAKRKYKSHNECPKKTADGKIFYFCNVNNEWSIECTCGKEYREFATFTNDFEECDIATVEEFFGLTHPSVIGMIEEMVDVDKVEGYTRHNDKK